MKRIITLLIISLVTIGISNVNGQERIKDFMKKRKESAGETTGERVDKEIGKGINKGFDKLFGTDEEESEGEEAAEGGIVDNEGKTGSDAAAGAGFNAIMNKIGIGATANVKDSYDFEAYVEMSITNYDKKGKVEDEGKYLSYIDADSKDYGMGFTDNESSDKSLIIFDSENGQMLTLVDSDGEKTGFAVAFNEEQQAAINESYAEAEETEDTDVNPYNIKKTGKSKKIMGYKCDEYQTEDEDAIVSIWSTKDLNKKLDKTFMRNSQFSGMFFYAYYTDGFVMEYVIEDKDDGDKSVMTVTDLNVDKVSSIKTSGYNIMSMGAMEMMNAEDED